MTEVNEIEFLEKPKHRYSSKESVIQCTRCKNDEFMSRIGKVDNYVYCEPCYAIRIDEKIQEWKSKYKHYRNGKTGALSRNDILLAPSISDFIN